LCRKAWRTARPRVQIPPPRPPFPLRRTRKSRPGSPGFFPQIFKQFQVRRILGTLLALPTLYVLTSAATHAPFPNSGTLFPKGTLPGTDWKSQMTFTAKDVGKRFVFDYTCAYHPWMTERIIVAPK